MIHKKKNTEMIYKQNIFLVGAGETRNKMRNKNDYQMKYVQFICYHLIWKCGKLI